jgi:non-ribosomal peptide synthetase component F
MKEIIINPTQSIDAAALTETERHQILVTWNDTTVDYPQHLCIHELFAAQVATNPDNIAVVCNQQQ